MDMLPFMGKNGLVHGKESWVLKDWCFWSVVLEKTLESPLDCKENQPVNPKGNQSWIFIGRTDAEAETLYWLTGKNPDTGKDWKWEEKFGWHHRRDRRESELAPGVGDGQGSLAYGELQGVRHDWATELNWWERRVKVADIIKILNTLISK